MKKLLILFIVFSLVPLYVGGQSVKSVKKIPKQEVRIVSGNPRDFKKSGALLVVFDFSDLNVGEFGREQSYIDYMKDDAEKRKKGTGDSWERKWYSYRKAIWQPKFIELFNKFSGASFFADTIADDQQFTLKLHTQLIEVGFNRNFQKSPTYINVVATLGSADNHTNPLVISMSNIVGDEVFSSYSDDHRRIEEAYAKCGKELARFMRSEIF